MAFTHRCFALVSMGASRKLPPQTPDPASPPPQVRRGSLKTPGPTPTVSLEGIRPAAHPAGRSGWSQRPPCSAHLLCPPSPNPATLSACRPHPAQLRTKSGDTKLKREEPRAPPRPTGGDRSGARVRQTDRQTEMKTERETKKHRGRERGIRGEAENDTVPLTSSCCLGHSIF